MGLHSLLQGYLYLFFLLSSVMRKIFHISGRAIEHNCVIWGSEPPREHIEHERNSPEVNMWYALTHKAIVGLFFFGDAIITSNSFLGKR
jgi:hypothetical protein